MRKFEEIRQERQEQAKVERASFQNISDKSGVLRGEMEEVHNAAFNKNPWLSWRGEREPEKKFSGKEAFSSMIDNIAADHKDERGRIKEDEIGIWLQKNSSNEKVEAFLCCELLTNTQVLDRIRQDMETNNIPRTLSEKALNRLKYVLPDGKGEKILYYTEMAAKGVGTLPLLLSKNVISGLKQMMQRCSRQFFWTIEGSATAELRNVGFEEVDRIDSEKILFLEKDPETIKPKL